MKALKQSWDKIDETNVFTVRYVQGEVTSAGCTMPLLVRAAATLKVQQLIIGRLNRHTSTVLAGRRPRRRIREQADQSNAAQIFEERQHGDLILYACTQGQTSASQNVIGAEQFCGCIPYRLELAYKIYTNI